MRSTSPPWPRSPARNRSNEPARTISPSSGAQTPGSPANWTGRGTNPRSTTSPPAGPASEAAPGLAPSTRRSDTAWTPGTPSCERLASRTSRSASHTPVTMTRTKRRSAGSAPAAIDARTSTRGSTGSPARAATEALWACRPSRRRSCQKPILTVVTNRPATSRCETIHAGRSRRRLPGSMVGTPARIRGPEGHPGRGSRRGPRRCAGQPAPRRA